MHRSRSSVVAAAIAVAAAVLGPGTAPASAQRTPTTTTAGRTTPPTVDPRADSFPVLRAEDLPDGYRMGSGSPSAITGTSPFAPTVSKCVWNATNRFSGLTPDIYQSTFDRSSTERGLDIVHEFADKKAARAYFDVLDDAYRAAAKCKLLKTASAADPDELVNIGTVSLTDVGDLGDETLGAVVEPSSSLIGTNRYAIFRDGRTVVLLRVDDDEISAKEFADLAGVAEERLRG